jgi:hypothetical protein
MTPRKKHVVPSKYARCGRQEGYKTGVLLEARHARLAGVHKPIAGGSLAHLDALLQKAKGKK